jgi:outer membrane protein OmpA-like peptidoglycan-associated protein
MTTQRYYWIGLLLAIFVASGCSIDPYTGEEKASNTGKGAGIGAVTGAVLGAAVSSKKDRGKGALTGAAVGAAAGGGIGYYMDRQEAQLRQRLEGSGVRVQRIGDNIKLIMPGNITFAVNSEQVQPNFSDTLDSVGLVLNEYKDTAIEIKGYTDSTGSFEHNQQLSERRAQSVARQFLNQGVASGRVRTYGYGPRNPVADNGSENGRAQNRRVEIDLIPLK